ncbi:histidine kinase [Aliiglaciecola sp. LCG003]|uniref:sensor histidine kinase n=1 Tax=Aliiglaciecola sp. LCG003 TaxID=3053655 RepID=UPI00257352EA|nr:histidine kinase [Aliiglaciecola sp. LCG003]WJG08987.1 histidine kinase [Aliiglaciecola sp. LCG003]
MRKSTLVLNRYFWLANIFFWLAVLSVFTQFQYVADLNTDNESSWIWTWTLMSPWFINWIPVTACVFLVVRLNDEPDRSIYRKVFSHFIWMMALLTYYWVTTIFVREFLEGDDIAQFFDTLLRIVSTTSQLDIFIYLGVLTAALGIRFYHNAVQESIELKRMHHALTQEQLKTLRSQLNPHFLFNALNTIASLVRLKREKDAVTALSELSLMLRKILENKNHNNIKVRDEIAFINSYLAIQKMRFSEKLDTHVSVQPDCLELDIPNMLLHPLVENAVQHGSQLESNRNLLNLVISRNDKELKVVLTNKIAIYDTHSGFGIGLTNTRERLSRLYSHFRLELHPLNDGLFETLLAIPIGEPDA